MKRYTLLSCLIVIGTATYLEMHYKGLFSKTTDDQNQTMSDEVYLKKIKNLSTAKEKYGETEMLYLTLANGDQMPVVALGTALMDERLAPHIISAAIDLGYRAIDTAYIYGNQKVIGEGIKAKLDEGSIKREDLYIMSKLWSTFHRTDLVEKACRASLEALGLEYFDLFMIHNPMSFLEGGSAIPEVDGEIQYSKYDFMDAWYGMEDLVAKGLVRSIGVSNFNSEQIQRILDNGKIRPVVNQVESHPYLSQDKLQEFCTERNVTLSCFGSLGSKGTPDEYKEDVPPVIDDPVVRGMALKLNVSAAQLLISYQLQKNRNVVVKSSSAGHLWSNLQALKLQLDEDHMKVLNSLNKNQRMFSFKGMGDTHKNYPFNIPF